MHELHVLIVFFVENVCRKIMPRFNNGISSIFTYNTIFPWIVFSSPRLLSQYLPTPVLSIPDLTETAHHREEVDLLMSKIILVTPLTSKQRTYNVTLDHLLITKTAVSISTYTCATNSRFDRNCPPP